MHYARDKVPGKKSAEPHKTQNVFCRTVPSSPFANIKTVCKNLQTVLVEMVGLEPMTSCMSSKRSNQLSYTSVCGTLIVYHTFSKKARGFLIFFLFWGFFLSLQRIYKKRFARSERCPREGENLFSAFPFRDAKHGDKMNFFGRKGFYERRRLCLREEKNPSHSSFSEE